MSIFYISILRWKYKPATTDTLFSHFFICLFHVFWTLSKIKGYFI